MNLNLRLSAAVLILAAVAAAPVFAGGQHIAPRCIPSDRHVLGCKPIPGPFDKASNDDVVQFEAARARKQAEEARKQTEAAITPAPVQTPTARELAPQQPKTPEPTAEPNAAADEEMDTILEDADISSGEEEEESSDDSSDAVAKPELDGDVSDDSFDDTAPEENLENTSEEAATDEEAENDGGEEPGECNSEDDDPDNDCE